MSSRRQARELAVQFLYQLEATGDELDEGLDKFKEVYGLPDKTAPFFERLVRGVQRKDRELDKLIGCYSKNWKVDRMSVIDRIILRLAAFEMKYCPDIPANVTINEAVELAKSFCGDESGRFINGVADALNKDLQKTERTE